MFKQSIIQELTSNKVRILLNLDEHIGQTINLSGIAKAAKGGPVIITTDNNVVYIEGIDTWSPDLVDKRISVIGILKKEEFIPQTTIDENNGISSGATGD
jgi:hypothetical protein